MARTYAERGNTKKAATRPSSPAASAPTNGITGKDAAQKVYELTDRQGHRAYARRVDRKWVVDADDPALRRRVLRALEKPLWVTEDAPAEDGSWWSTRVQLKPDDPRYANRLLFRWGQLGLDDLEVEVVTLPDGRPVPAADAVRA